MVFRGPLILVSPVSGLGLRVDLDQLEDEASP